MYYKKIKKNLIDRNNKARSGEAMGREPRLIVVECEGKVSSSK